MPLFAPLLSCKRRQNRKRRQQENQLQAYSMHIKGLPCVAGHMVQNVFYVVFLDKHHKFFPSDIQERGK
jgi:hypothetical protein